MAISEVTSKLYNISPIDGRYFHITKSLSGTFSEHALMRYRTIVEIRWFIHLSKLKNFDALPMLSTGSINYLENIINNYSVTDTIEIKNLESTTNHDVKAVEYFLKNRFENYEELIQHKEMIHFGLTSEDVNNIAYALMLKNTIKNILLPKYNSVLNSIISFALVCKNIPMLARTHGQAASPTTIGKEFAIFAKRLQQQLTSLEQQVYYAKLGGATGNYNALVVSAPEVNWPVTAKSFIESLDLQQQPLTTQIEPHDFIAEICHTQIRLNNILLDFVTDVWNYISLGYLQQQAKVNEVGSSTMPHKINPIDFENSEGNLGLANALAEFFANKLPRSRLQRDLSDSTVLRNLGTSFAYSFIALSSLLKGLTKITINENVLQQDLVVNPEVLAEAIQMLMRIHKLPNPYEQLKQLTRGEKLQLNDLRIFIATLDLPKKVKDKLLNIEVKDYIGLASKLVEDEFEK